MPTLGSTRHESFSFTYTPMASMWVVTLHYLLCTRTHPYLSTLLLIGSGYFRASPFPLTKPQHFSNLVILHLPAYEDRTGCFEISAYKIQTPGNYPEESTQHSEHGEGSKSRMTSSYCPDRKWVAGRKDVNERKEKQIFGNKRRM